MWENKYIYERILSSRIHDSISQLYTISHGAYCARGSMGVFPPLDYHFIRTTEGYK